MRNLLKISIATIFVATTVMAADTPTPVYSESKTPISQIQHGPRFVDLNGDGFNDNAPDHDNDGIPNGMDSDWTRPQDGSSKQQGMSNGKGNRFGGQNNRSFIDNDGDGICDNSGSGQRFGRNGSERGLRGAGFVDSDGNGVCDNLGTGKGGRNHRGGGRG
jgi:hypothetical protein